MSSENSISEEISALKHKVKDLIGEINSLKAKLRTHEISLDEFKKQKENLENNLRIILDKISRYKDKGTIETNKEAIIAGEAYKLMYEFQTEFSNIYKTQVYLSARIDKHFIFEIDFTNYPKKPKLFIPKNLQNLLKESFDTKISILNNWNSLNPPHITDIFYEIERIFGEMFPSEKINEEILNQIRAQKISERRKLIASAENEVKSKNIKKAIELYQKIIQISDELEESERVEKYSELINKLKQSIVN